MEQILIDDPARPSDEGTLRLLLVPRFGEAIEVLVHAVHMRTCENY
ncbi:hypothetical protein [Steroidobacter denitrificans]|nr:hypothetical protein [Steroidobacter denitrificans]